MDNSNRSTLIIAGAVVFAGLLIAAGVFFGDQGQNPQDNTENNNQAASAQQINIADVSEEDYIRGNIDATLAIVEYSDPECPFCKRFHSTMQQVRENYSDNEVAWVYRHFPIQQLHSKAPQEAQAMECAGQISGQDAFWQFADILYEETPSNDGLDLDRLPDFAEQAGVDVTAFNECRSGDTHQDLVQAEYQDAVDAGAQGTPYSVIVTQRGDTFALPGAVPFQPMTQIIDTVIAGVENDQSADEIQASINSIVGA